MINRNHSENSIENYQNKKKILIITKPKNNEFPKFKKKTKLLFEDPSNYLKLPKELNFNFIVGRKNKIKENIPYRKSTKHHSNNFVRILAKRVTRIKSSGSLYFDIKKAFESNKKINKIDEETLNNLRKKKANEVSKIFAKYRERINNGEENKKDKNIEFSNVIPSFMKRYINSNLTQQENALKCREEYNNIFKKMENNISKAMLKDSSFNNDLKNNKLKSQQNFYQTANLFKNSINIYRNKIEQIKLYNKKKQKNLNLNTHIREWEMSLRRPKMFNGLRKGYLNISSDEKPVWIMATEKSIFEEEKIINPNINDSANQLLLTQNYFRNFNKNPSKISNRIINLKKYNNLKVSGKKLIDFEETQADQLNGKIKILKYNYSHDSTKDLLFKMNCSINKHIFEQNNL